MQSGRSLNDGETKRLRLAVVSLPFASAVRPSIQLGLLKSIASDCGVQTETFHLNLEFAKLIGLDLYESLCRHRGRLVGDWLFSLQAFGNAAPDPTDVFLAAFESDIRFAFGGKKDVIDELP